MHRRVQLPLHGAFRQSERAGDLAQLQSLMVAHHEDDPLPRRQPADLGIEQLPQLSRIRSRLGARRFFRCIQHLQLGFFSEGRGPRGRMSAAVIDARVHDDSIDPGGQLRILTEAFERPVDLDEHLLRDVLGVVMIAGELIRHAIHHRPMALDQQVEGGGVSRSRLGDQVRIGQHYGIAHMSAI